MPFDRAIFLFEQRYRSVVGQILTLGGRLAASTEKRDLQHFIAERSVFAYYVLFTATWSIRSIASARQRCRRFVRVH